MTRIILAALIAGMLVYADFSLQPDSTVAEIKSHTETIRYCMNYTPFLPGAWPCAWLPMEQDV